MKRPLLSYSMQITIALLAKDYDKASKITAQAIGAAGQAIIEICNSFEGADLPFVLVAMKSTYSAMYAAMDQSGKNIVDSLVQRTECITVNASVLEKILGGNDGKKEQ